MSSHFLLVILFILPLFGAMEDIIMSGYMNRAIDFRLSCK